MKAYNISLTEPDESTTIFEEVELLNPDFIEEAMKEACLLGSHSNDSSTQNGAVLFNPMILDEYDGVGWNRQPRPFFIDGSFNLGATEQDYGKEEKYMTSVHAEVAAIRHAEERGIPIKGSTLVSPWAACAECAKEMLDKNIGMLIRHKGAMDKCREGLHIAGRRAWFERVVWADFMLCSAGVRVVELDIELGEEYCLLHGGEIWTP